ncbi:MAG: hypothetical protein R3F30_02120 [Planctomycetota bacterium]
MTGSPKRPLRGRLAAAVLALATACGGGGGGPVMAASQTTLAQAVFIGSSLSDTHPDPGELLVLYFSGDVLLEAGAYLDDGDLVLDEGSVGVQAVPPTAVTTRAVVVTLGTGCTFTPGTTTVRLPAGQDLVLDGQGAALQASPERTIQVSDGDLPSIDSLTLDGVPAELNGEGPAGGLMCVPRSGFRVDVAWSDPTSPIVPGGVVVTCSAPVEHASTLLPPGSDLAPFLAGTPGAATASLVVPPELRFATGDQALAVSVPDASGNYAVPRLFAFTVREATDDLRPFEHGQLWFLDVSRDVETLGSTTFDGGSTISFPADNGPFPNGVPDFLEALTILGLRSPSPMASVSGGKDSNEVALDLLRGRILARLGELFTGTGVGFTFDPPGSFPAGQASVPYASHGFSAISLGGSSDVAALGVAQYDPWNRRQEDDRLHPSSTPSATFRLGVFPHTLTANGINLPGGYFRDTFDPILDHRGTPVGEASGDDDRLRRLLVGTAGDARQEQLDTALTRLARLLAVVLAHECGHSMGLVPDGPPPNGMFGGSPDFPGSTPGHLSLSSTSMFPPGAQEVMAPAMSFQAANHPATDFNPLLRAWLQEKALYGN